MKEKKKLPPKPQNRAVLSGMVTDKAGQSIPNATQLEYDGEVIAETQTDVSGSYQLSIYPAPRRYDLSATSGHLGDWHLGIRLDEGEYRTLNLKLKESVNIEGTLLMLDDTTPHVAVPVQAIRNGRVVATTLSDESGKYRFINLKPGRYQLRCQVLEGYVYYRGVDDALRFTLYDSPDTEMGTGEVLSVEQRKPLNNVDFRFAPFKKGTWKNYTYLDGLADQNVIAIHHDDDGILWFGTRGGGVSRYDGKTFLNLTTEDGLMNNFVWCIHRDPDGAMWFGTRGGVSRYDGETFTNLTTEDGLANNSVCAISRASDDAIWFGTEGGGVSRYDGKTFTNLTTEDGLAGNEIRCIHQDADGTMWFATFGGGASRYDGERFVNFATADGLANNIQAIHRDEAGILWFGTKDLGVFRYDERQFVSITTNVLREALEPEGYKILGATSGERALQIANRTVPDLILLDIVMPGIDGFEACRRLKSEPKTADIPVIFITVNDEVEKIVTGFQVGGVDYITKSAQKEELLARVKTHLKINQLTKMYLEASIELAASNRELQQEIDRRKQEQEAREQAEDALMKADERLSLISQQEASRWGIEGFIGKSRTIAAILNDVRKLQNVGATSVLILGESGTGKELIARAIHFGSARALSPFIPVNCSTIPRELAESTLFGYVRGAFTGANQSRKGHFELASGGTLFLDEIGDLPLELQPKLLRVLEEGCFTPLGGTAEKRVDVRILAATNQDLPKKIAAGKFREDLYFRLARFPVTVPPLRERKEDIPLLVEHFLRTFGAEMGIEHPKISVEALESLKAHHFPGNVRELKNIIEHALILSGREQILPQHLHFVPFTTPSITKSSFPVLGEQRRDENILVPHQVIQSQEDLKSVQKFISECCEIAPYLEVRKPEILAQYLNYCHAFGYRPVSRNKFYELVLQLCPQVVATQLGKKRLAGFKGLSVKSISEQFE